MWTRSELKACGKSAFKANYWRSVLSAFLLSALAGSTVLGAGGSKVNININESAEKIWETIKNLFEGQSVDKAINGVADNAANPWFVALLAGGISVALIISILLRIFVFNPIEVGANRFFRENVPAGTGKLKALKDGFQQYGHVFVTLFLRDLFIWLWSLLFVIPGIIKSYAYRMVPYIVKDEPDLSPREVLKRSKEMMRGHKWRAFVLDLSFLGWFILGALSFGVVNVFWADPYYQNTNAALYLRLKGEM